MIPKNNGCYVSIADVYNVLTDYYHQKTDLQHAALLEALLKVPPADVRSVPPGGIGEMSDGYHTFNGLYYQRMVLFAALVKQNKDSAWKSHRHEDGELCFGGGWFIVGIDTPEGSYTYHYEDKDWDLFDCKELPVGKHWDGHTEEDVTRLLSLPEARPIVYCKDCIHRPYEMVPGIRYGLTVESPDRAYKCPCFCDGDGWYSYIPDDDFFCGNGERLREGGTP